MKPDYSEPLALLGGPKAKRSPFPARKRHGELEKRYLAEVIDADMLFYYFGDNTASILTADGFKLFDAAVDWAANVVVSAKPTLGLARQANGSVTITFTGRLESSDSLTTPNWQAVTGTGSVNVQPSGQQKYYRAANP